MIIEKITNYGLSNEYTLGEGKNHTRAAPKLCMLRLGLRARTSLGLERSHRRSATRSRLEDHLDPMFIFHYFERLIPIRDSKAMSD
jgi:hypothetical protein